MVFFAIRCFFIGAALAVLGWLLFGFGAVLLLTRPGEVLVAIAITVIGGLCGLGKAPRRG